MSLDRTRKLVLAGVWGDAALVMAASAWNGGLVLQAMGDPAGFGTLLGLAVDAGLAVALIGDRTLHLAGRSEPWSRRVRNITAAMSLGLNCAVPFREHHWGQMIFHAFLPVLLVLLSEYAQKLTLQFMAITNERAAQEVAEREALRAAEQARIDTERRERADIEMRRAQGELVTAQDKLARAVALREQAEREIATIEKLKEQIQRRETIAPVPRLSPKTANPATTTRIKSDKPEAWARAELLAGHDFTGADLDKKFGLPRGSGARIKRKITSANNTDEPKRPALHAVKG